MANRTYNSQKHHRRSIRLKDHDYSQPGAYFLTVCTHKREPMFGEIAEGKMVLNRYGEIVSACWHNLPNYHPHVNLDAFVVMPNHVYGIVIIEDLRPGITKSVKKHPVTEIVRVFKTSSSRRINNIRGLVGTPVWQRNYWERVIRNQDEFNRICEYISNNPQRWHLDKENAESEGEDDFDFWLSKL